MNKNLKWFDRLIRFIFGVLLLLVAVYLFHNTAARIAIALFGIYALGEGLFGICPLVKQAGAGRSASETSFLVGLLAIQSFIAYQWWGAGFEKITGTFATDLPKTLGFFASQNPLSWMKNFLTITATSNAAFFAQAVQWSQIMIAIILIAAALVYAYLNNKSTKKAAAVLSVIALLGALAMNLTFYLAAGWTGPGTKGVNVVMFWTEATLVYVWLKTLLA